MLRDEQPHHVVRHRLLDLAADQRDRDLRLATVRTVAEVSSPVRSLVPETVAGVPLTTAVTSQRAELPSSAPQISVRTMTRSPGLILPTMLGRFSAGTTWVRVTSTPPSVAASASSFAPVPPTAATRASQYAGSVSAACRVAGVQS